MPCPTCDHTLESIEAPGLFRYYHCPRCGTFVIRDPSGKLTDSVYVPKLVERCRTFGGTLGPSWGNLWHRLGIAESINTPEGR